jgi:hypothetical protein
LVLPAGNYIINATVEADIDGTAICVISKADVKWAYTFMGHALGQSMGMAAAITTGMSLAAQTTVTFSCFTYYAPTRFLAGDVGLTAIKVATLN